jgi:hypothetical protein
MITQKINYIHANPVKAGFSKSAKDYPWSSFRAFYGEEPDPLLQVDKEWWWPDDIEKLNTAMAELQSGYDKKFEAWREAKINRE